MKKKHRAWGEFDAEPREADVARQLAAHHIRESARQIAAEAPPLNDQQVATVARLLGRSTPPSQLMRWRIELLCGHAIEHVQHVDHREISSYAQFRCAECDEDWVAVAVEPLGTEQGE